MGSGGTGRHQFHRLASDPPIDLALTCRILESLVHLDYGTLTHAQQLDQLRVLGLVLIRLGTPDEITTGKLRSMLDSRFPAPTRELNSELCRLLVYLKSPYVVRKALDLVDAAPTQEEKVDYIKSLRMQKKGWTPELRARYFSFFQRAVGYHGGASFDGYISMIKADAMAGLNEEEQLELKPILRDLPSDKSLLETMTGAMAGRSFVKDWQVSDLVNLLKGDLSGRDTDKGRRAFGSAGCFACHRFGNEGGAMGPDLTQVGRRFSPRDLMESIIDPNRAVSDLYGDVIITTKDDEVVIGRIVYLGENSLQVNSNMFNPAETVRVNRKFIKSIEPSTVSPMPEGLLNTLNQDEILDLAAFLISGDETNN